MSEETNVVELEPELQDIVNKLDQLTLLQASKVVKHLEDHWGVSAAAPVAVAAAAPGAGAVEEEKTTFDVMLKDFGAKKIQVIKEVRAITSLGLKEAKDLVESAPTAVKEGCTKEEAEQMKEQLEASGATVELA